MREENLEMDEYNAKVELSDSAERLASLIGAVVASCREASLDGEDSAPFPSRGEVVRILEDAMDLLLPGRPRDGETLEGDSVEQKVGRRVHRLLERLSLQIALSKRHACMKTDQPCSKCSGWAEERAMLLMEGFPPLRKVLLGDIKAAYERDPAARSLEEVVLSYPGLVAITIYRLAHELWLLDVPFIPRMMTEHAHGLTGIDIHPGAEIGANLFIDHGTGVVIGETTQIGDNVTIYQGVTLGGYRFRRAPDGSLERGYKRHPTVGDDVIIYAGATILGGDTVIGARTLIGGSVWLTHSVPSDVVVMIDEPDLKYRVGY